MNASEASLDQRLVAAHQALREGGAVQFDLTGVTPPAPPPAWLKALGEFLEHLFHPVARLLRWLASLMPDLPYARFFLWGALAILAVLIVITAMGRIRDGVWRLPRFRKRADTLESVAGEDQDWQPHEMPARAWLREADALAEQGRFAEAAHHLLLRNIEDLARRRAQLVRPALTSRDLANATGIPAIPKRLFARIATIVENSFFGGQAVDAAQWERCRADYSDFILPRNWAR